MATELDCADTTDAIAAGLRARYLAYNAEFRAITQRARQRFEQRTWHDGQRDAAERIGLYDRHVDDTVAELTGELGDALHDRIPDRVIGVELWLLR